VESRTSTDSQVDLQAYIAIDDTANAIRDTNEALKDLTFAVNKLVNLLIGDACTYKAIVEAETVQVPVASREQHLQGDIEYGTEVSSVSVSASSVKPTSSRDSSKPVPLLLVCSGRV
jgi:hypothetical protein